ncbi:helix-turn-helix domain-containing protein [Xanthomonas translucens]|uniref:helix-turn-helix domain-containing protein n=2 Tax=Xanthomonas campestris pv. translucens TaxID=343 RepID=UPI0019D50BF4|nr:helix-turn-helix domain-containing protein [Xanthomonas translucens]QSQ37448.1 helix-turn-helix domain-containing protein [Xanthomonas translucens pv. translucens]
MPASSRYAELDAPPALRDRLRCSWRFRQGAGEAQPTQVLPDGCVDLIWDGRALFVAGPDRCASSAALAPGSVLSGVRLAAGAGACVLGVPLHAIADQRVALEALWDGRGRDWKARLEDGADPLPLLQALCASRPLQTDQPMAWLFAQLAGADAPRMAELRRSLGISERTLRRRCQEAFGYGAKTLERILRLQRFLRLAPGYATLTAAALQAGYGDAPHLVRDSRQLTGLNPRELVQRHAR